jgi:hypothetical protein
MNPGSPLIVAKISPVIWVPDIVVVVMAFVFLSLRSFYLFIVSLGFVMSRGMFTRDFAKDEAYQDRQGCQAKRYQIQVRQKIVECFHIAVTSKTGIWAKGFSDVQHASELEKANQQMVWTQPTLREPEKMCALSGMSEFCLRIQGLSTSARKLVVSLLQALPSAIARSSAAFSLVCQPRPPALKCSTTLAVNRRPTGSLGCALFGRPSASRALKAARPSSCVTTLPPTNQVAFLIHSSVSSGASSGSTQGSGELFSFSSIGVPHRNDAALSAALCPNKNHQSVLDEACGNHPLFSIIKTLVFKLGQRIGKNGVRILKVQTPFLKRFASLVGVISDFQNHYCIDIKSGFQVPAVGRRLS